LRLNKKGQRIRKYTKERWKSAKFCSHKCYGKSLKGKPGNREGTGLQKEYRKKVCKICGLKFECGRRTDKQWKVAKYCSVKCLVKSKIGVKMPWMAVVLAQNRKHHKGKKHWNWKGGITPYHHRLRQSTRYITWRNKVYKRDRWTCQKCGKKCRSETIVAHHKKNFLYFPKLRYNISNGVTLCRSCHKKVHKRIGAKNRF
jgi:hypothetical protein